MVQGIHYDVCVIGGAGHIGLPLGVACAQQGLRTVLLDKDESSLLRILQGDFPFMEQNGGPALQDALRRGTLFGTTDPEAISRSRHIICVVGTPVDEYMNPAFHAVTRLLDAYRPHFRPGQTFILRSTVYPGTTDSVERWFRKHQLPVHVAFCPERIVEGRALEELRTLPQIVSAYTEEGYLAVEDLFRRLTTKKLIRLQPTEAELSKLFSNAWRYIKFSVGNQFFMMAEQHGLDYRNIYNAMVEDYDRNRDLPSPGFAAGPCLLKDTMQLAAFNNNLFFLGHAAMLVNEGLPKFLMDGIREKHPLSERTVGILGMAFKAESDDVRDSLSYKLKKLAQIEAKRVLCHDPYVSDESLVGMEQLLAESDVVILAAPHHCYRGIDPRRYPGKHFVDIWGLWPRA